MPTLIENLADFASSLDYRKTTSAKELEQMVKIHLLDSLGIALYSSRLDYAVSLFHFAEEMQSAHDAVKCSVISTKKLKTSPTLAAFLNGSLIHGIDFDDTDPSSIVHPSSFSVASALAICETLHADGPALINSILVSMEVSCRIGSVAPNILHLNGFHPTSVCGAFGAAAGVSRAVGLDSKKMADAMSIAGSMASGTTEGWTFGKDQESWSKRIQPGWAALIGIVCSTLAKQGFSTDHTILEGRHGFYFAHAHGLKVPYNQVVKNLLTSWRTLDLTLKFYPCGYAMQAFVECAVSLNGSREIDPEKITTIVLRVPKSLRYLICEPVKTKWKPGSSYSAKLTYPYPVSAALIKGKLDHDDFTEDAIHDASILKLARKVSYRYRNDEDPPSWPQHAYAEVWVKSGNKTFKESCYARGTKENPGTFDDVKNKFIMNTKGILSPQTQSLIVKTIENLDRLEDCTQIFKVINEERSV